MEVCVCLCAGVSLSLQSARAVQRGRYVRASPGMAGVNLKFLQRCSRIPRSAR